MAASVLTVRKRVTEILNACAAGTYSEAVDTNYYDRNSLAIAQAVKEAAMQIAVAILTNPQHVYRGLFVSSTPTAFTHGQELPDMAGEMDLVEIQPYSGGPWITAVTRDIQQIEAYRANKNDVYSTLDHTVEDSPLSGYYALSNNKIYFTGHACRGYFPVINAATVTSVIPDEYEGTWVALAIAKTVKEGDNLLPIAQYYYQLGISDLQFINAIATPQAQPSIDQARAIRGN